MTFPRTILLTGLLLVAAAVTGAVAQASTVLSTESAPTRVAAFRGTVMWSQLDSATGQYRLVQSVDGGAPTDVGVRERPTPFDVDLGTNRSGNIYAVYTRNGDIIRLNPRTGVEGQVLNLSSPTREERDPSIMRGEITFIRREGGYDQVRTGNTTRASHGSHLLVKKRSVVSVERGISHVAYVERVATEFGSLRVHVRNVSTGHDKVVYEANSGGANTARVTKPSYDDNMFYWARTNLGSQAGNRIVRYALRGSKRSYGLGSSQWNTSAWAGEQLGLAAGSSLDAGDSPGACEDAGRQYCRVELTGPVAFGLRP